jgi:hypothetical protein
MDDDDDDDEPAVPYFKVLTMSDRNLPNVTINMKINTDTGTDFLILYKHIISNSQFWSQPHLQSLTTT